MVLETSAAASLVFLNLVIWGLILASLPSGAARRLMPWPMNSEVKRVEGWSNPRMGDPLGSCSVSSQEQIREGGGVGPAQSGQYLARWSWASPLRHSDLEEASWELTGFGFVGTPKLSELEARAIQGWVTTLGSCFVSSQKQNRAGW
ncbi:hypothetical protein L3X38_024738 [Prunus dulcis]|uniref:Uncharacterized protein n=1 Tax=Prunus dulcis TaxID=3755 RepID=A0AAD4W0B9_PRUDU|nr:hypothetical protein L3X38_024738 [Prunus dulcis]